MTRLQIVNAVLKGSFDDSDRTDALNWIEFRHAWLWDLEQWSFKIAVADVTFTSGARVIAEADAPADIHATLAMYDASGEPVRGVSDPRVFFDRYNANVGGGAGRPEAYTIVDGRVFLSRPGDGSAGIVVYEKTKPALTDDASTTGIPDGYDLALVHGGKAEGFKLTNIPLADNFDADFTAAANALRRSWLQTVKEAGQQFGAYRP